MDSMNGVPYRFTHKGNVPGGHYVLADPQKAAVFVPPMKECHSIELRHSDVVVDIGAQDIGVVVDAVTEVLRIPTESVEPPASVITTSDSEYLLGIAKLDSRLIILLDLEQVLTEAEQDSFLEIEVTA